MTSGDRGFYPLQQTLQHVAWFERSAPLTEKANKSERLRRVAVVRRRASPFAFRVQANHTKVQLQVNETPCFQASESSLVWCPPECRECSQHTKRTVLSTEAHQSSYKANQIVPVWTHPQNNWPLMKDLQMTVTKKAANPVKGKATTSFVPVTLYLQNKFK